MKTKPRDEIIRSVRTIQWAVAKHFNLKVADIIGPSHFHPHIFPRRIAMLLTRLIYPRVSYPQLGFCFNRDHTTVMTGCESAIRICMGSTNAMLEIDRIARALDHSLPAIDKWPGYAP